MEGLHDTFQEDEQVGGSKLSPVIINVPLEQAGQREFDATVPTESRAGQRGWRRFQS